MKKSAKQLLTVGLLLISTSLFQPSLADSWGVSSFENDDALDWAFELEEESLLRTLASTAEAANSGKNLGLSTCAIGLAIADILSAMQSKIYGHLPDDVAVWARANRDILSPESSSQAQRVISSCAKPNQSALASHWVENSPSEWKSYIAELNARLKES